MPCSQHLEAAFNDAFVIKLNPTGSALLYSSYLGGSDIQGGFEGGFMASPWIVQAFLTLPARPRRPILPTQNPLQPTYGGGGEDAFVAKTGAR